MSVSEDVRTYCIENYIQPARNANENEVTIRAGDVHSAMNLSQRLPLVCSALGANVFEQMANVERLSITGPSNGANTLFQYRILNN
jgi:5-methylcytosine-specific restriction protein B